MDSRIKVKWQLHLVKWDKIGDILKKSLVVLFVFTVAIQLLFLLNNEGIPPNNALDMEGKSIIKNPFNSEGEIILEADILDKSSSIVVFINGEKSSCFNSRYLALKVKDKDVIEISGIDYKNDINISIYSVSDNIVNPKVGFNYKINNNIISFGKIKMKQR